MDTKDRVAVLEDQSDWLWAGRPEAYEAFANGKLIFDVSPDARELNEFVARNASEYGQAFELSGDGNKFKFLHDGFGRVYYTFHKHGAREDMIPELQRIEVELQKANREQY